MKFLKTEFKDLYIIEPGLLQDDRGWFMRTYDVDLFKENISGFQGEWKQMNHSHNVQKGTFRGLHYQKPPFQEIKCIRCVSGAVIDYAVDLRQGSETFLKVFQLELSAENKKMIVLPKGFAHGFFTIQDNSELVYLHDQFYKSEFDAGIYFKDELLIDPIDISPKVISAKDQNYERLSKDFKGI
jgi:dTDP-4-dehydrorhamnose 3,5-epimerase